MALPQWKWPIPSSHVPTRAFCNPAVDAEVSESRAEHAQIRLLWSHRKRADITSYAQARKMRHRELMKLASSVAVASIRLAVRDPGRFERWVYAHGIATRGDAGWRQTAFDWGSGAGWGNSRGNTWPGWFAAPEATTRAGGGWLLDSGTPTQSTGWGSGGAWGSGSWGPTPSQAANVERVPKTPGKAKRRRLRRRIAQEKAAADLARREAEYQAWLREMEQREQDEDVYTGCY